MNKIKSILFTQLLISKSLDISLITIYTTKSLKIKSKIKKKNNLDFYVGSICQ